MRKRFGLKTALVLVFVLAGIAAAVLPMAQLTASSTVFGQPNATTGTAGTGSTSFSGPQGIFVDATGRVWVCDLANNRVLVYASTSDTIAKWAISSNNDTTSSGANLAGARNEVAPYDVAYYKGSYAQFVAVADSTSRVLVWVWSADSTLNEVIGRNTATNVGESLPALVIGQYSFTAAVADSGLAGGYTSDSALSIAASNATSLTFGAATTTDTVYLYVAIDTGGATNGGQRILRFALRDTFLHNAASTTGFGTTNGTGRESAVLSYPQSRTSAVPTPFGQAPRADAAFGDTVGVTSSQMRQPWDLAFYSNSLYVADMGNNRVLRFDTANYLYSGVDTYADGVYGQTSFTNNQAWFTGSDTGLRAPANIAVSSAGGLVVGDSPQNGASGRVVVFDGSDTKTATRWFGMDAGGNMISSSGVANATTIAGTPSVATYSSTVLAGDPAQNRILTLASAVSAAGSSVAAADDSNCAIDMIAGRTGLQGVLPAFRGVRDTLMGSVFGRLFVSGYYAFGMMMLVGAGLTLALASRR